jgi:molybdopterin biosynthesis enzyme
VPLSWNNSGHVAALTGASGLLRAVPGKPNLSSGENVDVILAGELS